MLNPLRLAILAGLLFVPIAAQAQQPICPNCVQRPSVIQPWTQQQPNQSFSPSVLGWQQQRVGLFGWRLRWVPVPVSPAIRDDVQRQPSAAATDEPFDHDGNRIIWQEPIEVTIDRHRAIEAWKQEARKRGLLIYQDDPSAAATIGQDWLR